MHVRLERIKIQVEVLSVQAVRPARTPRQQGPLHARIVSLENMQLQVERQRARPVLPIRRRQSRAHHLSLVFVSLVLPATGHCARLVWLEHIKIQVERQCARLVLSIRLRQSRAQHLGLVLVALVSPARGRRARL